MNTRRLFEALFGVALLAMAMVETLDPDMWWHLRTGEYILAQGLPRQDVFSFTVPDHAWITHEWLSQVFMWLVYQAGGLPGLMLVFALLIALTYWLVYLASEGRPYVAAFVTLLAAIAAAIVWGARPQIFNMLFTAVFVFIVERVRRKKLNPRFLWLMPAVMVVWANAHSGYLLGVVLLGAYTVGEALQRGLRCSVFTVQFSVFNFQISGDGESCGGALAWPQIKEMAAITAVSFLVAVLNPNGPTLWIYPFQTLGSPAMQQYIQEWQSPNFHAALFWPFAAMALLGALALVFSPKRPSFTDLLLYFGPAAAGFLSARHIPLFTIMAAPIIARHITGILRQTRFASLAAESDPAHEARPTRSLTILNWAVLLVAILGASAWALVKIDNNQAAIARIYPVAAVDFLEEAGLAQAPGYNSYNWGGYLIWRGLPVFIDGRADVYGDDFIFYYLKTFELQEDWRQPLDDYNVAYVIMETGSPLNTLLAASGEWQEAYADDVAQIFIKK